MKVTIQTPTKAYIETLDISKIQTFLSYENETAVFEHKRLLNNQWLKQKYPARWKAQLDEAKNNIKQSLLFSDGNGLYVRPASLPYLVEAGLIQSHQITNQVVYPSLKPFTWVKAPIHSLYPYQEESCIELLKAKHGAVELCTGAGKSRIIAELTQRGGLKTVVIAPSKSIFLELLERFEESFGKKNIGTFGNGKKKLGLPITICIGDSLANVKENTPEWEFFSKTEMVIFDESHLVAAQTLERVCNEVFSHTPYRFFLSGTQVRGAGDTALLHSIIGKILVTLSPEDAVKGGYICPHQFRIVEIESSNPKFYSSNPIELKREHLLRNSNICNFIARLANSAVLVRDEQVLVLVEEMSQISDLVKLLEVPYAVAHSETKPERLIELGLEKVNSAESVKLFNQGKAKVLIGSSSIRTGTNIYPMAHTINWMGSGSEVTTRQGAVGRSVRFAKQNPWADQCGDKPIATIWDFHVVKQPILENQLKKRISYYEESGKGLIKFLKG